MATLAKTTFTNWKGTGNLHEAAMEINTNKTKFALTDVDEGVDLQAVITHEVGHWIGIAHSGVAGSIMQAHYCESRDRCGKSIDRARALSDDDIEAVCALYPPGPGEQEDRVVRRHALP